MADTTPTIRSVYKPLEQEKQMLIRVYDRYIAMKNSDERHKAELEWTRGRKQWEALRQERLADDWQSNHFVPLTTAVVETALAEIIDKPPEPLIMPRGIEDNPKVMIMDHIFKYTWEVSDSDLEFEDILHDALIEGTGIGQEYFYSDVRKIKTTSIDGDKTKWNEEDRVDYNDSYLENVKNDDFFVDENARSFRGPYGARDSIRRYIMDIEDFRNFFRGPTWDPLGNAKYVQPGGDTNYYEFYKPPTGIDHSKKVEVLWYWAVKPDDWLTIIANDVTVLMGPNPYKHKQLPFARAIDVKRTHKFYGKGEAALLESIQDELNTLRRMVIDRNHLDIDKMFIGSNRLNMSEEDLIARPHGFIGTDDPEAFKAVEYGDVPRSVEISKGWLEDDSTIATGVNPRAEALPTNGTATEAAIIKESTLKRIRLKVRRIEREFLTRVARLRVANILQYYPQAKLEKIVGEAETAEYKKEVADLQQQGLYTEVAGQGYKKVYRSIRLENTALMPDSTGGYKPQSVQGFSFFTLKPEDFMPTHLGYDIKFEAGSTLPVSKPLLQSKVTEMYDRLIILATSVPNTYSPKKLGDMLLRVNDMNPAELSAEQSQQQDDSQARIQMSLELANTENNLMMKGKEVPSTAFQPAAHTLVHVTFTKSPEFQALTQKDPRVQIFIDHITGEMAALNQRQGAGGPTTASPGQDQTQPGQPQGPVPTAQPLSSTQNGGNRMVGDLLPNKIQGGGQTLQQ